MKIDKIEKIINENGVNKLRWLIDNKHLALSEDSTEDAMDLYRELVDNDDGTLDSELECNLLIFIACSRASSDLKGGFC